MPSERTGSNRQRIIDPALSELASTYIAERKAAGASPITLHIYRRILNDLRMFLFEKIQSEDIRLIAKQIMHLYIDRVCSYSFGNEEKRAWIARLQIFFRWLTDCGIILSDPAAAIKMPRAKKRKYPIYLSQHEIANLLDAVPVNTPIGLRDRAILELLYSSGLRSGEIIRLTLADINFADGVVRILMSKGKKDRMVPIGKVALHWLDRYVKEVHGLHLSSPLFYHFPDRTPLFYYNLRQIITKYRALAGLKKPCHPRNFRHSFAIHLLENGASIRHIQEMMGHASLKTTQKYTRIVPAELKRMHAAAHPAERKCGKLPDVKPSKRR
jgi:integrase/recombinase XerD